MQMELLGVAPDHLALAEGKRLADRVKRCFEPEHWLPAAREWVEHEEARLAWYDSQLAGLKGKAKQEMVTKLRCENGGRFAPAQIHKLRMLLAMRDEFIRSTALGLAMSARKVAW
jgi:hypothetical protein